MALLHKSGWLLDKKPVQLPLGYHYDQSVRSVVIPEGQQVTFYTNEDRQGFKSKPFSTKASIWTYRGMAFIRSPVLSMSRKPI